MGHTERFGRAYPMNIGMARQTAATTACGVMTAHLPDHMTRRRWDSSRVRYRSSSLICLDCTAWKLSTVLMRHTRLTQHSLSGDRASCGECAARAHECNGGVRGPSDGDACTDPLLTTLERDASRSVIWCTSCPGASASGGASRKKSRKGVTFARTCITELM